MGVPRRGDVTPGPIVNIVIPTLSRDQMEAVQALVYDLVPADEDRRTVLAALFQPPQDIRTNDVGKRLYRRSPTGRMK